jgi:hypothetical protein
VTTRDATEWSNKYTILIIEYTIDIWKQRNESIHGATPTEGRQLLLEKLRKRVDDLFNHPDRQYIPATKRDMYKLPAPSRKKQGINALTTWIKYTERRLKNHREEATKNTIHRWLEKH